MNPTDPALMVSFMMMMGEVLDEDVAQ